MTAVDIPSVQVVLRDKLLRTAQQQAIQIANRLSEGAGTATSSVAQ